MRAEVAAGDLPCAVVPRHPAARLHPAPQVDAEDLRRQSGHPVVCQRFPAALRIQGARQLPEVRWLLAPLQVRRLEDPPLGHCRRGVLHFAALPADDFPPGRFEEALRQSSEVAHPHSGAHRWGAGHCREAGRRPYGGSKGIGSVKKRPSNNFGGKKRNRMAPGKTVNKR